METPLIHLRATLAVFSWASKFTLEYPATASSHVGPGPYKGHLKGKHWVMLTFRGLVHYHSDRKHGGIQANMALEKEPRVLHLDQQKENDMGPGLSI